MGNGDGGSRDPSEIQVIKTERYFERKMSAALAYASACPLCANSGHVTPWVVTNFFGLLPAG